MKVQQFLTSSLLVAILCFTSTTAQADIVDLLAADNATVQPTGPRSGTAGKNFFNIEGSNNGDFSSYGVIDFDLSAQSQTAIDVTSLTLKFTQSNAGFTANGSLNFWITEALGVGIQPGDPIIFDMNFLPDGIGSQLNPLHALGSGVFTQVANGNVDEYTFGLDGILAQYVLGQVNSGGTLRLVVSPGDAGVAATWAGFGNTTVTGPLLGINVTAIPEPSGLAVLLSLAGVVATRRRR